MAAAAAPEGVVDAAAPEGVVAAAPEGVVAAVVAVATMTSSVKMF